MFFKQISFRIGLWYSLAFLFGSILIFALTAFLLMSSLEIKDHDLLNEKIDEYSALYVRDGIKGLQLEISSLEIKHARDFLVRLTDRDKKTLYIHAPNRSKDEAAPEVTQINQLLRNDPVNEGFTVITVGGFGDDIDVVSKILPSGDILQVGKDIEDREELFKSFAFAYLKGLIPIALLSIVVGGLLSLKLLKPIRTLTNTVVSIRAGEASSRVELHQSQDELWQLGTLFNQMLDENQRLVQGMKDTVDNVAHDLRTPIMRLQNAVEGSLRGQSNEKELRIALENCHESSEMLLKLVNGIMDISEANTGFLNLKRETIKASSIVDLAIDLYGFVAEEKNITLVKDIEQDFSFLGDRMRLLQVMSNILDNAIKYSPENTVIRITSVVNQHTGTLLVSDQGIGIPDADLTRIWDRLYRVDASRSSRGLGLGLSLVKAIVEAHGGTVGVASNRPDPGTQVYVRLTLSS